MKHICANCGRSERFSMRHMKCLMHTSTVVDKDDGLVERPLLVKKSDSCSSYIYMYEE